MVDGIADGSDRPALAVGAGAAAWPAESARPERSCPRHGRWACRARPAAACWPTGLSASRRPRSASFPPPVDPRLAASGC